MALDFNQPFGKNISQMAKSFDKSSGPFGQTVSALAQMKKTASPATLQAAAEFRLQPNTQPTSLLQKASMAHLEQALSAYAPDASPVAAPSTQAEAFGADDFSPAATAQRILDFTLGHYENYAARHSDSADPAEDFVALVRGAIDQGFQEARDILGGLKMLDQASADIDATYQQIEQGLSAFLASPTEAESAAQAPTAEASTIVEPAL